MNTDKIKELSRQAYLYACEQFGKQRKGELVWNPDTYEMKLAELIVLDCANFVRDIYDHEHAESIAWTMEVHYGLHGDYA